MIRFISGRENPKGIAKADGAIARLFVVIGMYEDGSGPIGARHGKHYNEYLCTSLSGEDNGGGEAPERHVFHRHMTDL